MTESWTSEEALTHAIDVYADYFFTQVRKRWQVVQLSQYLVARWGLDGPHVLAMYVSHDGLVAVHHYSDEVELSGGRGLRMATFRAADASWALRYVAALHLELDNDAGRCAFEDPRCPRYVVPAPNKWQPESAAFLVDFTRFTSAGFGTLYGPEAAGLQAGQRIRVTDVEADIIEATVVKVDGDVATVRAHWNRVLDADPDGSASS